MTEKPAITARNTLFESRIFRIDALDLTFPNGEQRQYECIAGTSGSVMVIPITESGEIMLVREYAAPFDRYELSLPKGRIEAGEDPLEAANREIMEEIGYGAHDLKIFTEMTLAPGYIDHSTTVVLAQDLYPAKEEGDEPEELEVVSWPVTQIHTLVQQDDLTEARSIAAILLAKEALIHA